jgi:hypothetical protein
MFACSCERWCRIGSGFGVRGAGACESWDGSRGARFIRSVERVAGPTRLPSLPLTLTTHTHDSRLTLTARCSLLTTHYMLLTTHDLHLLLAARCSLLTTCCSLLTTYTYCSLLTLLTTCCSLLVERVVGRVGHGVVGVALGARVLTGEQSALDLARLRGVC